MRWWRTWSRRTVCPSAGPAGWPTSTFRPGSTEFARQERATLRERLKELAGQRRRFGYRRLHALLRREGWRVNHKAVHRIYVEEGLQVRRRKRKRLARVERQLMLVPQAPNQRWSMDFQHDLLATGQRLRTLNIVDVFSRECPAIEVDTSLPGVRVVRVLVRLAETRGLPKEIILDNGPEMIGKALDQWAWRNGGRLHFMWKKDPAEGVIGVQSGPHRQRVVYCARKSREPGSGCWSWRRSRRYVARSSCKARPSRRSAES